MCSKQTAGLKYAEVDAYVVAAVAVMATKVQEHCNNYRFADSRMGGIREQAEKATAGTRGET